MGVICYAGDTIEDDRRTPELYNAPIHITQNANRIV